MAGKRIDFTGATGREPSEKLTVAVVREALGSGVNKVVLTVKSAFFYTFERSKDRQLFVEFAEFEGYTMGMNKTQALAVQGLVNAGHLSDQADDDGNPLWAGARIPMFVKETSFEEAGRVTKSDKFYAVAARDYKTSLAEYDQAAKKAAKKVARR